MKPLLLKPIPNKTIWGCNRISKARKQTEAIGTWWEVSAHPYCTNQVINLDNPTTLQELIEQDPEDILGPGYSLHEMLRLAYLDTQDALSIQVHPEDDYALTHSNDYGKYESWYIIDAAPEATLVAGTNTKNAETIKEALDHQALDPYLQTWHVKKGDFIVIPSGMIHALGKDILALEIGTNSNTTYRFYDYNRKDAQGNLRPLHLKESFDITDFSKQPIFVPAQENSHMLIDGPYIIVEELYVDKDFVISDLPHYCILTNIEETPCTIEWRQETIEIPGYDSVFVPYSAKSIIIKKGAHVLYSQPKKEEHA